MRVAVPTGAGAVTLALALVLVLIGLRAANPWLLMVGCALLAPVAVSQLLRPDLSSVRISFRGPDRVETGEWTEHVLVALNRGRRSAPELSLVHHHPGFAPVTVAVPALAPGATAEVVVPRLATRRCRSSVHRVELRTTAPFGMAVYRRGQRLEAPITVQPAVGPVARMLGGARLEPAGGGAGAAGSEMHELREWRHGDSLRQVHWRATARHDRLTVVIPETLDGPRLALVVLGPPADPDWEALISTAAWTAVDTLRCGGSVYACAAGMWCSDPDPDAVLDWFAALPSASDGTTGTTGTRLAAGPADPGPLLAAASAWAGGSGVVVVAVTRPEAWAGSIPAGAVVLDPTGQVSG